MNHILCLLLFSLVLPAFAEEPQKYREPKDAIIAAKKDDRLIFFLLAEGFEEASLKVEAAMVNAVKEQDGDFFILGICQHRNLAHRAMFEERFKKDVSKAPVAVICDSSGKEITGCYGQDPDLYVDLLRFARLKAGKFANKEEEERLKRQLAENEERNGSTIFGMADSTGTVEQVELSAQRIWHLKDGNTFHAALLTADGSNGTFVKKDSGEKMVVEFNSLTGEDIAFLQKLLSQ